MLILGSSALVAADEYKVAGEEMCELVGGEICLRMIILRGCLVSKHVPRAHEHSTQPHYDRPEDLKNVSKQLRAP